MPQVICTQNISVSGTLSRPPLRPRSGPPPTRRKPKPKPKPPTRTRTRRGRGRRPQQKIINSRGIVIAVAKYKRKTKRAMRAQAKKGKKRCNTGRKK